MEEEEGWTDMTKMAVAMSTRLGKGREIKKEREDELCMEHK
jgi:hypothetical protein